LNRRTNSTQMQRVLALARAVADALFTAERTMVRFGVATGPATVSYIATHQFA
jgi:hypothetical protein